MAVASTARTQPGLMAGAFCSSQVRHHCNLREDGTPGPLQLGKASRATIRLPFIGSFQDSVQQLPHVCLRVWWPLGGGGDIPSTIFNLEGNAANFQFSEAHWFPNHFNLYARPLTA